MGVHLCGANEGTMTPQALNEKTREELPVEVGELHARQETLQVDRSTGAANAPATSYVQDLETERNGRVEAERLGRIKDEFLANLSHEIRTPLNAILGWSQLLKPGVTSNEEMAEGLEVIQRNVRIQVHLIDDLLDMSRIISGKLRLDVQRVELPDIIRTAVEIVQLAAQAKGIRLELIVDPIAGPITGDPNRMQQVVWNLLSNAIKFTPKGGKVQITLERTDSHVELSVSDTGQGISLQYLPHVFDKFSQAESPFIKSQGGLGLGLTIAKHLVEMHGGSLHVKSAGIGKGATFVVSLPISVVRSQNGDENHQHPTTAREVEISSDPDLSGVEVLLVDNDADALHLVKRVLETRGANVTRCSSGAECLNVLRRSKPNVIVADIGMPDMDGYSLMRHIRALPADHGKETPAIALTAFARSEDRRRAMLAGFDMHVAKPVEPGELVAVIARLARRT
jgi:signal transduction histidine kinase/ActR/RegA family two-component response regulator